MSIEEMERMYDRYAKNLSKHIADSTFTGQEVLLSNYMRMNLEGLKDCIEKIARLEKQLAEIIEQDEIKNYGGTA